MHIDVGPWARLLRSLSTPRLFALGAVLVGAVACCYFEVPVRVLRPIGPLIGLALGVGVCALLFGLARIFAHFGKAGIAVGITLASAVVAAGAGTWYALHVVQPRARGACWNAARPTSYDDPAASRARGRTLVDSVFFGLADRIRPDPTIAEDCYHDEPDAVRAAHGLCPRSLRGDERCHCGFYEFPSPLPCPHPRCEVDGTGAHLACD
jgi:hypothetical protein